MTASTVEGTSTTVDIVDPAGGTAGTAELPAAIFDVTVNIPLIHQVVVAQQAAARQGTHSVKNRGEVSGGGRKPYRQKGTGRARQGSTRAPQFTGGGVVHGPVPRSYAQRTPKKMKAAALRGALTDRARGGKVHVLASLVAGDAPSTRGAIAALGQVGEPGKALVVIERTDIVGRKSLRNIPGVHVIWPDQLNTYDVLVSDDVVFTAGALESFLRGAGIESPAISLTKPAAAVKTTKASKAKAPAAVTTTKKAKAAEKPVADDAAGSADGAADEAAEGEEKP